jgi:hypothetical protein
LAKSNILEGTFIGLFTKASLSKKLVRHKQILEQTKRCSTRKETAATIATQPFGFVHRATTIACIKGQAELARSRNDASMSALFSGELNQVL